MLQGRTNPRHSSGSSRSVVQSIIFDRRLWTPGTAAAWLREHGHAVTPVDVTTQHLRFRQQEPDPSAHYATRAAASSPGVQYVVMWRPASPGISGGALRTRKEQPLPRAQHDEKRLPGNRLTSDAELDAWGRANIPGFLGVISRTEYDSLYPPGRPMTPGSSCVINLDGDYANGGTHWTCARVSTEQPILMYFDSFGFPPPREVTLRARKDGLGVLYPDIDYQGIDEVNCGPRSLAALKLLADGAKKPGGELAAFSELGFPLA
jgi:hypothetical protein